MGNRDASSSCRLKSGSRRALSGRSVRRCRCSPDVFTISRRDYAVELRCGDGTRSIGVELGIGQCSQNGEYGITNAGRTCPPTINHPAKDAAGRTGHHGGGLVWVRACVKWHTSMIYLGTECPAIGDRPSAKQSRPRPWQCHRLRTMTVLCTIPGSFVFLVF